MPPMEREDYQRIAAFHAEQKGSHLAFSYVLPRSTPLGILGGAPKVTGTYVAGADVVTTRGWPANTRVLRAGDYIRFAHTKVYQVNESVTTDGSGNGDLRLAPNLIQAITDGDDIVTTGVTFQMSFVDDFLDVNLEPHQPTMLYSLAFSLVERY